MGYTTDFDGSFEITPPLTPEQRAYIVKFSGTRRVRRDEAMTGERDDPVRAAVGLPVGEEGGYFVGADGYHGWDGGGAVGVIDSNTAPAGQPGLWCQWVPSDDGAELGWDGGEKFYEYVEWLKYLVQHFLTPWGRTLDGTVQWQGEASDDIGRIVCEPDGDGGTYVETQHARIVFE